MENLDAIGGAVFEQRIFPELEVVEGWLDSAVVQLSFWGGRYIAVAQKSGSVLLDELAITVSKVVRLYVKKEAIISLAKCERGENAINKVKELYRQSEIQAASLSYVTQFCLYCRKWGDAQSLLEDVLEENSTLKGMIALSAPVCGGDRKPKPRLLGDDSPQKQEATTGSSSKKGDGLFRVFKRRLSSLTIRTIP